MFERASIHAPAMRSAPLMLRARHLRLIVSYAAFTLSLRHAMLILRQPPRYTLPFKHVYRQLTRHTYAPLLFDVGALSARVPISSICRARLPLHYALLLRDYVLRPRCRAYYTLPSALLLATMRYAPLIHDSAITRYMFHASAADTMHAAAAMLFSCHAACR